MRDISPILLKLLADHVEDPTSTDDRTALGAWLEDNAEHREIVDRLLSARPGRIADTNGNADASIQADIDEIGRTLAARMNRAEEATHARITSTALFEERRLKGMPDGVTSAGHRRPPVTSTHGWRTWTGSVWRIGMVSALCGVVAVAGWLIGQRQAVQTPSASVTTYSTNKGERGVIHLPDGSTVLLNVASRISIPTNFSTANRTVQLTGEALFTVSHTDDAPFVVVAGPSTTRVLGTSFVVRHYDSDTAAVVAVRDGKVSVGPAIVTAAQEVTVGWSGIGSVRKSDSTVFSFAKGTLMLNHVMLRDAIQTLNRWYNVDIQLGDATLGSRRITSTFSAGSITDLATVLDHTFDDIGIIRNGRTLTFYRR